MMLSKFKNTNKVDERRTTPGASNRFKNTPLPTTKDCGDEHTNTTRITDLSQFQLKNCKIELSDVAQSVLGQECCESRNCKTCNLLHEVNTFRSSCTNQVYPVSNSTGDTLTCGSENIIYLITCSICKWQYVGETGATLRGRMNGHRNGIKNNNTTYLYRHFKEYGHGLSSFTVQIIEKVPDSGDKDKDKQVRLQRELFWMQELWTIYPYGMNDNVKGYGNISHSFNIDITGLLCNARKRRKRSHGKRKNNKSSIHTFKILESERQFNCGEKSLHEIRSEIYQLPLAKLHQIEIEARELSLKNNISDQFYLLITDLARLRLYKPVRNNVKNEGARYFIKLPFNDKGIDAINLGNIFHNKLVKSKIPEYFENKEVPMISYKYTKTIRNQVINYNEVLKEYKEKGDIDYQCDCKESTFCYTPHGHVMTGDLNFIENEKLRNLILKGPKYREQNTISWSKNKKHILEAVEKYAKRWCKREKAESNCLDEWVNEIRTIVKKRITHLAKTTNTKPEKILDDPDVKTYLEGLKEKYVLVPADKASNNIIIVCKKFYIEIIKQELGVNTSTNNVTYAPTNDTLHDIMKKHSEVLTKLKVGIPSECYDLPKFYWIPKMHKDPFKFRFIAGSRQCTTKPLSKLLTKALQKIKEDRERYCEAIYRKTGVNRMWIVKNSASLLEKLKNEKITKATHVSTWDFSTLYTTIPQQELKERICKLIDKAFDRPEIHYINISPFRTYFSDTPSEKENYVSWNVCQMREAFRFLIDNIYVKFGDDIFKQTLGIPMGTDCAPVVADLFLHTYEYDFLEKLTKKKQLHIASKFNLTFRYIDDLISINNDAFEDYISDIYQTKTSNLELKKTTESDKEASYLDLMISITRNGELESSLYDKRDEFNFKIVNFPYLDSNIPVKPAYGVYNSQLVRYTRACTHYKDFLTRHRLLVIKLMSQGYQQKFLKRSFISFFDNHKDLISKYDVTVAVHIKEGIFNIFKSSAVSGFSQQKSSTNVIQNSLPASSTSWIPTGLRNLGNSCYLNAILQCIFKCETVTKFLRWSKNARSDMLIQSMFGIMEDNKEIAEFHDILITTEVFFDQLGVQQDAHEALLYLLNILHLRTKVDQREELGLSQELSQSSQMVTSAVTSTFHGSFKVSSECSQCQKRSTCIETFQEISIECAREVGSGMKNSLVENVQKLCQSCSRNVSHCITKTIWQQPRITIVRINRFKQTSRGRVTKNHSPVCAGEHLHFDGFKANLIGIVSHKGSSSSSGHYVSYVSIDSEWYRCSDEQIARARFSEFSDSIESYILFYQMET